MLARGVERFFLSLPQGFHLEQSAKADPVLGSYRTISVRVFALSNIYLEQVVDPATTACA